MTLRYSFTRFSFLLSLIAVSSCLDTRYPQGQRLYKFHCAGCHMENGTGLLALYPPIAESDFLAAAPDRLPCIIQNGLEDTILVNGVLFENPMAGIEGVTSVEIANICNYIRETWYPQEPALSASEVEKIIDECNEKD